MLSLASTETATGAGGGRALTGLCVATATDLGFDDAPFETIGAGVRVAPDDSETGCARCCSRLRLCPAVDSAGAAVAADAATS